MSLVRRGSSWYVRSLTTNPRHLGRLAVAVGLGIYGVIRLRNPEHWDLLDDVNLAIHEAGHVFFQPLGDTLVVLGGSLLQVLVPLLFVAYFLRQRESFSASVVAAWLGASLCNVALYIADSRAQQLPLLGGENVIHDWWYLLTEWDLLSRDVALAGWVRGAGAIAFVVAVLGAAISSRQVLQVKVPLNRPAPVKR